MEWLTNKRVLQRVHFVRAIRNDDEMARIAKDALYRDVLNQISDGHPRAREIAALAVELEAD